MDALLVQLSANPYFDMISAFSVGQLGLYYLAEYADKAGYSVKVKYYNSFDCVSEALPELINKCGCRIVGFYVDCDNIWAIRALTPILKQKCPTVDIILGGPQVTGDPYGTLQLVPCVTCGVIGEGELPFLHILQAGSLDAATLETIGNIIYTDINKTLRLTPKQPSKHHIDDYGFPHREKYCLDPDRVTFSQLISGRGCMGRCAFCYEGGQHHSGLRIRNIDSCLEEIDYLVNTYNVKYINFVDDTFILNRSRTEKFCNEMIKRYRGEIKWYCEARADIISKNTDILPLLKDAGLVKIQLGGESGCQEILDVYKKGVTIEELKYAVTKIAEAGIAYIYINFIIGGAFETENTFDRTLSFAKELMQMAPGCVEISSSVFTPTPGAPMYEQPETFGLKIIDKYAIRGASCSFVFAETDELNQYKIWQLRNKFNNEINHEYEVLLDNIPLERLSRIFDLSIHYNIETAWSDILKSKAAYRNYFEPIARGGFCRLSDIDKNNILRAIPFRTLHPGSDGVAFYHTTRIGEHIKNSDLENILLTLSAGKLMLGDILNIIKSTGLFQSNDEELLNRCLDVYRYYEDNFYIIWKLN